MLLFVLGSSFAAIVFGANGCSEDTFLLLIVLFPLGSFRAFLLSTRKLLAAASVDFAATNKISMK